MQSMSDFCTRVSDICLDQHTHKDSLMFSLNGHAAMVPRKEGV